MASNSPTYDPRQISTSDLGFSSNPGNGSGLFGTPSTLPSTNTTSSQPLVAVQPVNPVPYQAPTANSATSSTTLSNANKINQVQQNAATLDQTSQKGISSDVAGGNVYANGTQAKTVASTVANPDGSSTVTYADGSTSQSAPKVAPQATTAPQASTQAPSGQMAYQNTDASQEDQLTNNIIDHLMAMTDANTATQLQSIQSQFAIRTQMQDQLNQQASQRVSSGLLMGGANGQGSSSQFAPISSSGIIQAQESYGIQQLASLDAQEDGLIAAARQAQFSNNFQLMGKKLDSINMARNEKYNLTAKLNDQAIAYNKKLSDDLYISNVDNAVADVFSSGMTGAADIAGELKKRGITATAEQIANSLKNIVPPGLDDLVKTASANGATPEVMQAILNSKNLAEAYKAAGAYSSGGTGDVAEYNFYKAQALAKGQVPLDYLSYIKAKKTAETEATAGTGIIGGNSYGNQVVRNTINMIGNGATADMTVSQAIATAGLQAVIDGIVKQEGGTPQGTNNPGNIKFAGQKGATQGKKATDGGYFANFSTPEDFNNTIKTMLDKNGSANLANYIAKYKGVTDTYKKDAGQQQAINTILASGKFTKDQAARVAAAINSGDDPMPVIKNNAKDIMGQTVATKVSNLESSLDTMKELDGLLQQYYDAGGNTNILGGKYEKVLNSLGAVNDPALVNIAASIATALQAYRNAVSGTAYSVQEGAEIASVFPGIEKGKALNDALTNARINSMEKSIDDSYRNVLGSSYDKLKGSNLTEDMIKSEDEAAKAIENIYLDADDATVAIMDELALKNFTNLQIYEYLKSKGQLDSSGKLSNQKVSVSNAGNQQSSPSSSFPVEGQTKKEGGMFGKSSTRLF